MNPNFEGELYLTQARFRELPDQDIDFVLTAPPPSLEAAFNRSISETVRNQHTLGTMWSGVRIRPSAHRLFRTLVPSAKGTHQIAPTLPKTICTSCRKVAYPFRRPSVNVGRSKWFPRGPEDCQAMGCYPSNATPNDGFSKGKRGVTVRPCFRLIYISLFRVITCQ